MNYPVTKKQFFCSKKNILDYPLSVDSQFFSAPIISNIIVSVNTAPVTHQDQGHGKNILSDGCVVKRPLIISLRSNPSYFQTPVRKANPENLWFHAVSKVYYFITDSMVFSQPSAGSRHRQQKNENQGRNGCQSDLVVLPTPILVHRLGQLSCKELATVKFYIIPHNVISCSR